MARASRDEEGKPNFKYVATHICDSIERRLKTEGAGTGLQGEFGMGLLSFWTVGEEQVVPTGRRQRRAQPGRLARAAGTEQQK